MYYQQGDYYRGDYYRGDPSIFSAIGGYAKKAFGTLSRLGGAIITGGGLPGAAAAAAGLGVVPGVSGRVAKYAVDTSLKAQDMNVQMRGGTGKVQRGGLALQPLQPSGPMLPAGMPVHGMRRTHLNKSTYYRRGGGVMNLTPGLVEKGTEFVPNRRMNVTNPRALRRALRRAMGFGKIVKHMKRAIARANSAVGNVHRARKTVARRR